MFFIFGFLLGFILASYLFYNKVAFVIKAYEFVEVQIKNILNKKKAKDEKPK
ncbi:hypothetical protein [uncultured Campylobacter sp.]|uniref:hypothetical protein n=1 Tax=uncultured Campylobacter sp. TaxID=218934 RepID=UPI00261A392D|nr:hypothetical protein [uncultured Campylobacter sp.]